MKLLLLFLMSLSSLRAADLEDLSWTITDGEVTVTDCVQSASGDLIIPPEIENFPVTQIGTGAFAFNYNLRSIVIPDTVQIIGEYCFSSCYELITVVLPIGLTEVAEGLFSDCYHLREVTIPDNVTRIGQSAFSQCQSLTEIAIPDSVITIEPMAFYIDFSDLAEVFGPGLQNVSLGQGLVDIGYSAFEGQFGSLTSRVTIPATTTSIKEKSFFLVADIFFDGPAPETPDFSDLDSDLIALELRMALRVHFWPQHLDSFDPEDPFWSSMEIVIRDTTPKVTSLSLLDNEVRLCIAGAPGARYRCKTSFDLETFTPISTTPEELELDSSGKMEFKVNANKAGKFFLIEEIP